MNVFRLPARAAQFRSVLALATIFAVPAIRADDEPLTPIQTDRLMAFGQLWGFIKYSHPWLAHRGDEWDEAFVETVSATMAARSAEEYRTAVEALLQRLGDPITRVLPRDPQPKAKTPLGPFAIEIQPEAVVVRWGDWTNGYEDGAIANLKKAAGQIVQSKAMIVDLRGVRHWQDVEYVLERSGLTGLLVEREIRAPAHRVRLLRGYPPDTDSTSGGYYAGLLSLEDKHFAPRPGAQNIRCVFIVTDTVPPLALALHDEGRAAIIAIGRDCEEFVTSTFDQKLPDNVVARIRLDELVHADGRAGFAPDVVVPDAPEAFAAAHRWFEHSETRSAAPNSKITAATPSLQVAADAQLPTIAYRMLAAFRAWTAIEYFFPYKKLMDENWTASVRGALPGLIHAATAKDYHLAIMRLMTHLNDTHVRVNSEVIKDIFGRATPPFRLRMIDGAPVVSSVLEEKLSSGSRVAVGDELVAIAGQPWRERFAEISPYLASSTPETRDYRTLSWVLAGPRESIASVTLRDPAGVERNVSVIRNFPIPNRSLYLGEMHPNQGEIVRLLRPDIGFVDLTRLETAAAERMFARLHEMRAIILDLRGYPLGLHWKLWSRLVERADVPAALVDPPVFAPGLNPAPRSNPPAAARGFSKGRMSFSDLYNLRPPSPSPRYTGRTIMLIDERTISLAEFTGMAMRAAAGTVFIGSPTAGANGDVTWLTLPGGITVSFTGQSYQWPDGRQLQRVGLIPDVPVRPTKAGMAAGRDEVLEAALAYLDRIGK